jgi:hypothetical protein
MINSKDSMYKAMSEYIDREIKVIFLSTRGQTGELVNTTGILVDVDGGTFVLSNKISPRQYFRLSDVFSFWCSEFISEDSLNLK